MSRLCKQKGCQNEQGCRDGDRRYCQAHSDLLWQASQARLDLSRLTVAYDLIRTACRAGIDDPSGSWLPDKNDLGISDAFRPLMDAGCALRMARRHLESTWKKQHAERVAKACEKRREDEDE